MAAFAPGSPAAGDSVLSRNTGNRRTPAKRALLKAIEGAGGTW
jgi:hypothetical protein